MTYELTESFEAELDCPFTDNGRPLGYGSVVSPCAERVVTRVPRPASGLLERLGLRDPGFDETVELRYHWTSGASEFGGRPLARWAGWSPTENEAWDACSEVRRDWAEKWDHRPFALAQRAAGGVG